ncbi:MAG: hypothetical protein F6K50_04060 [Moorea sp. SIO3I7]|nr:hypothetical protein [Moorena sp. SIO3I7]
MQRGLGGFPHEQLHQDREDKLRANRKHMCLKTLNLSSKAAETGRFRRYRQKP